MGHDHGLMEGSKAYETQRDLDLYLSVQFIRCEALNKVLNLFESQFTYLSNESTDAYLAR